MRRLTLSWIAVIMAVSSLLIATLPASAHVLERDGPVSAVLHMPPDDSPVSGGQTIVNFAFATNDSGFNIAEHAADVSVLQNNRRIQQVALQPIDQSPTNASATVAFSEPGTYELAVSGKAAGKTPAFSLTFDIRVGAAAGGPAVTTRTAGADFWILSIGSLTVLAVIAYRLIHRGGRYRTGK